MSKHSPGPWTVFNNQNSFWQIQSAAVGKGYYSTIGSFCQRDTHPTHGGAIANETAKANATLAAAAPEMLEALKFLVEVFGPGVDSFGPGAGPGEIDSIAAARAAIEKATAVS